MNDVDRALLLVTAVEAGGKGSLREDVEAFLAAAAAADEEAELRESVALERESMSLAGR